MSSELRGILTAMVTPFTQDGKAVDYDRVGPLVHWLIERGTHGLFVCGTTGEGLLLSVDERKRLLETVHAAADRRVAVVAHTGALDTSTVAELTAHAADTGADAAGVTPPGYYKYDDNALEQFYRTVAGAAPGFPVLLYNIPGNAGNALSPQLIVRLANEVDNIAGIKDSSGDMKHLTRVLIDAPEGFQVLNGADEYGFQAFLAGASGAVSGTANVVLDLYKAVYEELQRRDLAAAWQAQIRLTNACGIFAYGQLLGAFKEGMRLRGFDPGAVRPPQRELTAEEKRRLAHQLETAGLH